MKNMMVYHRGVFVAEYVCTVTEPIHPFIAQGLEFRI